MGINGPTITTGYAVSSFLCLESMAKTGLLITCLSFIKTSSLSGHRKQSICPHLSKGKPKLKDKVAREYKVIAILHADVKMSKSFEDIFVWCKKVQKQGII